MTAKKTITVKAETLVSLAIEAFIKAGMSESDATISANALVQADLEGVHSHGISRLPVYIRCLQTGKINPTPSITINQKGAVISVDGDNGLGIITSMHALNAAIPTAKELGLVGVAVKQSNHFGAASYYCKHMCQHQLAMIAFTNSPKGMPPWGGKEAYFGTNPIAFGFPYRDEPIVVDLSTSVAARGKIILAAKNGEPIPTGWAVDENGRTTTDAEAALKGAILPMAGPKGYALALAVEMMAAMLTGAAFGPHVGWIYDDNREPADVGHFFILMDIAKFIDVNAYEKRVEQMKSEIKANSLAEGFTEILLPGERKQRKECRYRRDGIPVAEEVWSELQRMNH
ncbi:Ldh family oxidoreductase [Desmospora activa]|uniref:Malate dehydrogenase (NAD) n=1 Tax=Desmospora activa DSM 45169 TaxID=1121389 RepID=A0A2T4ZC64_9BACL|nr:Ldh family oxidoreductase [Desmospora activa]PTM59490.1 malate dehydrogenase (NAD) [Desmospora activa DSM 45169]